MMTTEILIIAGGCFWGVEESFRTLPGVVSTRVGYTAGAVKDPTYEMVCTGTTGHAEAVEIMFDPAVVSVAKLLDRFFDIHDATQVNRQGPDVGEQYRSAIFYTSPEQKEIVEDSITQHEHSSGKMYATQVVPATTFFLQKSTISNIF
jgi:methionine-S-sulfoxide reductase